MVRKSIFTRQADKCRSWSRFAGLNDMSLDDVMIAITLGGLFLSGAYIRARFRELRKERALQIRRSERVSKAPRDKQTNHREMGT
jgi:hypothetical protein